MTSNKVHPTPGEATDDYLNSASSNVVSEGQNQSQGQAEVPASESTTVTGTSAAKSATVTEQGGPIKKGGKRRSGIQIFFWKLWILSGKCFIQRMRAHVLFALEFLFVVVCGCVLFFTAPISGKGKGITLESDTTVSSYEQLLNATPIGDVYYAPDNAQTKKIIEIMMDKLSNSMEKPRFVGAKSEAAVEAHYNNIAFNDAKMKEFVGAIIFEKYTKNELKYKLRFPLIGGQNKLDGILPPVSQLFSKEMGNKMTANDRVYRSEFGVEFRTPNNETMFKSFYELRGLLALQILIDESASLALTSKQLQGEVILKSFPYPSSSTVQKPDSFVTSICPNILMILLFMNCFLAKNVIGEKETGVKELMKLSGYPGWMQWLAWYLICITLAAIYFTLILFVAFVLPTYPPPKTPVIAIAHSDPSLWFFVMLLGAISNFATVFFICGMFRSAAFGDAVVSNLSTVAVILAIFAPSSFFSATFNPKKLIALCLIPQYAFLIGMTFLAAFEGLGDGVRWTKIAEELPGFPGLCLGDVLLMMFVDTLIYTFLGTYVESVLPSEFGVRKPLHYPFSPIIDLIKKRKSKTQTQPMDAPVTEMEGDAPGFENRKVSTPAGIVVKNIVKKFGPKIAVNNVSLTMYEGEIFALLGHNGAGKTTLISILSGMISPTSGTATINGYDIKEDIEMIRQSLGLCPQHDMIFNNLTVMEHLKIFGAMKGQSSKEVKKESESLLETMQLKSKANAYAKNLSGGQKRKLCLGMALCGGASVVVLDEPTSGMDPEARRVLWNLLLKIRGERTILLTTHFMEEADVLGDHIAIMAAGKIQCSGTPAFLKSFYGSGWTLKISLLSGGDKKAVLTAVQKHIPDASINPIKMESEMFIILPTQSATSSTLSSLFSSLTEKKQELNIESIGLSRSSLDDVFVKVGELAAGDHHDEEATVNPAPASSPDPKASSEISQVAPSPGPDPEQAEVVPSSQNSSKPKGRGGIKKLFTGIIAVFLKKVFYLRRKIYLTYFMLIFPAIVAIYLTLTVSHNTISPDKPADAFEMNFGTYIRPVAIYTADQKFQGKVKNAIGSDPNVIFVKKDVKKALLKHGMEDGSYRHRYIFAGEMDEKGFTAWYNKYVLHSPPLAINLASNARAPPNFKITVSIHPLDTSESLIIEAARNLVSPLKIGEISVVLDSSFRFILFLILSGCFLLQPVAERLNKATQLQLMTGVNPFVYWIIAFIFDLFLWIFAVAIMIVIIVALEKYKFFSAYEGLATIFLVSTGFGVYAIPFTYLVSRVPKTLAGGVCILMVALFLPVLFFLLTVMIIPFLGLNSKTGKNIMIWIFRIFPYLGAQVSFGSLAKVLAVNAQCNYFTKSVTTIICKSSAVNEFLDLKSCCKNCKALGVPCFKPEKALYWTIPSNSTKPDDPKSPGIWQYLACDLVIGLLILFIHILIDFGFFRLLRALMINAKESDFLDQVEDDDVQAENHRVMDMVTSGSKNDDAFIVDNLCKSFKKFSAVSKLRFGVHHGECFGLLGTNGAGKTTTFRMITGDEVPSLGNAYEGPISLRKNRRTYLSNIGYCPQFDGFLPPLSGKENLLIFALLRGLSLAEAKSEVKKWLEKVGLEKDGHLRAKNYSGGMKRRLSAAMAMIGDPGLILLDEPTSGVDPLSRRQFWKVLDSVRSTGNQAVILTSHSMDECETLCSRLGIMVNGQLQCLGGVQHLKHKFAQGYSLTLKLKNPTTPEEIASAGKMLGEMNEEIKKKFDPCSLKEQHETLVKYQIMNTSIGWNVIYSTLEELKKNYSNIVEDYSVSETTLEEVFLSFAQKQYGLRESKTPLWKRILTCQC